MTAFETLSSLAAEHTAKFMEDATPATSRQIGFLAAIIRNNKIAMEEITDAVDFYNGGHKWGMDKECASALIASFATKADMIARAEKVKK